MSIVTTGESHSAGAAEFDSAAPVPARPARSRLRPRWSGLTSYLFLAPGLVLFAVTVLYPTVQAFRMSFFDWKLVGAASEFLGLDNYARAFQDDRFWLSLSNSGVYMALTVVPQIVIGLAIALL